ncbi:MAG: YcaO-like family protein [Desulfosarcinaceae bacterium]
MRPEPLALEDAFKQFSQDQDKVTTPEQTVRRFKERLAQTGLRLLEEVVRVDNGRLGIPVYFSICGEDAYAATGNYKQMGKGASPAQAQASAVMELAERFSLFSFSGNPSNFIHAAARDLDVDHLDFQKIAQSVNDTSGDLPVAETLFRQIPLQWTWAHDLARHETVLIPFNWFFTINEFNGSSAGNADTEAICQGICEIVERHVCALISRHQIQAPLIDPESVGDAVARELMGKYRAAGIELFLSDFTADMGIPSIGALAWDPETFPGKSEIVWTAGTMPSASKALCRALTEVAQLAGDFNSSSKYVASGLPKFKDIDQARHITQPGRTAALNSLPDLGHDNIRVEVERCMAALQHRGLDTYVVNVTHPQLKIPAFYTVMPGTLFRERTSHASVAMICGKIVAETLDAESAASLLQQFDKALPGKYFFKFYLGQVCLARGLVDEAAARFREALDLAPPEDELATIKTYLAMGLKDMERYDEALEILAQADELDPERTDTLNLMGYCYYKQKAYEKAVACFQKIIALNPSSAIDYANLASNYRAMGEKAKAIEYYQLALALDPGITFASEHLKELAGD